MFQLRLLQASLEASQTRCCLTLRASDDKSGIPMHGPTCCSEILSFRADLRSVAVLSPRTVFSRHVLGEAPDKALRPRKMEGIPLIEIKLLTATL